MFLDRVGSEDETGAGFGEAAGEHGAAFPESCVAAGPVESLEAGEAALPGVGVLVQQASAGAAKGDQSDRMAVDVLAAQVGGVDLAAGGSLPVRDVAGDFGPERGGELEALVVGLLCVGVQEELGRLVDRAEGEELERAV